MKPNIIMTSGTRALFQRNLLLLPLCLLLWGCPGNQPSNQLPTPTPAPTDPSKVVIRGSNTIGEELAPKLIAEFKKEHPDISFDLETKATGYGMAALRVGQCDLAAASRPAIAADLELAKEAGVEMNDHIIGAYSVAVVINAANPVANLTEAQVHDIFTGQVTNWKDVGGNDAAIQLCIRDPISGTYLGFKELAMNNEDYAGHAKLFTEYGALAKGVAADPNAIGYTGFVSAKTSGIKAVTIGAVAPTEASVHEGKYPYARVLRFYTNKARESDAAKSFLDFVLSVRGQEILQQMDFSTKP